MNRKLVITINVLLLHLAVLWGLQRGQTRHAVDVIIPGEIIGELLNTPAPPAPRPPTPAAPQPAKQEPQPLVQQAPTSPMPTPTPEPAPVVAAQPAAPAAAIEARSAVAAPAAPAAPARIELPSSDAAYLNNPRPTYPALSKRLGEQGKVVVRVLIGVDGSAQQVEIKRSSGHDRLDQAALATVRSWRYVPGKRNGVPEAMWYDAPINFVLE